MNFPLNNPIFRSFYWLVNTPGLGGFMVALLGGTSLAVYGLVLQWIRQGGQAEEVETYSYPTPALHDDIDK